MRWTIADDREREEDTLAFRNSELVQGKHGDCGRSLTIANDRGRSEA